MVGHEFHHCSKIRKSKTLLAVVHITYIEIHGNKQERGKSYTEKLYIDEKTYNVSKSYTVQMYSSQRAKKFFYI